MDKLKEFIDKYRSIILLISVLSSVWLFCASLFIDINWLWLTILVLPTFSLTLYAYRDRVYVENKLSSILRYLFGMSAFISLFIVLLSSLFITPWWWFGLTIPLYLYLQYRYFKRKIDNPLLSKKDLDILLYVSIGVFVLSIGLYFVPSVIANDGREPQVTFSTQHTSIPILESYQIYYESGDRNREHVIAHSWFEESSGNYVNDYVNIIWSNMRANGARGNFEFNEVNKNHLTEVLENGNIVGYKDDKYFMPLDRYKGDVARIILYMYVTYKDNGLPLDKIDIGLMKSWSYNDPVDQNEIDRNNAIKYQYQYGNRFVENSWLIVFII